MFALIPDGSRQKRSQIKNLEDAGISEASAALSRVGGEQVQKEGKLYSPLKVHLKTEDGTRGFLSQQLRQL